MNTRVQVMRGPKLDRAQREMWYTLRGGRKVRISAMHAYHMLRVGTAVEVFKLEKKG